MKTSAIRILLLSTMLLGLLIAPTMAITAVDPILSLSLTPAGPGGSTTATVSLAGVSDIESFTLTMDLSDVTLGSILSLATGTWFSQGAYLPSRPFGTVGAATSPVERNKIDASTARTKIFFDGFKPYSSVQSKVTAGTVSLIVSPAAVVTPTASTHKITLTGEYLSKSTQKVTFFPPVTTVFTTSDQPLKQLAVSIVGNGSVNSDPSGTACTVGTCNQKFPLDSKVTLTEASGSDSAFTSWSGGGCSGTGATCTVTMTGDQTVTATFSLAHAVRLLTTIPAYYNFLQTAFSAATGNVTIQGRATTMTENLTIDKGFAYIFRGGFNGDFTSQSVGGMTTLQGKVTIVKGSMVADRLVIR